MNNIDLNYFIINLLALLIVIIPHEIAHGYVAYLCGDKTAKDDGRLSLNPLKHIDPIGLIFMILFKFGWAKPVPINPSNFTKNKKFSIFAVSIAGVFVNLLMGFIVGIFFVYSYYKNLFVTPLVQSVFWYSIMLGLFNLVPLPPLDGSKIVVSLLPDKYQHFFYKYERYFYIILVLLLFSGKIAEFISPIISIIMDNILKIGVKIWGIILY